MVGGGVGGGVVLLVLDDDDDEATDDEAEEEEAAALVVVVVLEVVMGLLVGAVYSWACTRVPWKVNWMAPVEARVASELCDWAPESSTSATTLPALRVMLIMSFTLTPRAARLLRSAFLKRVAAGLASEPMRVGKSRAKARETEKPMGMVVLGVTVGPLMTLMRRAEVEEADTTTSSEVAAWMV